TGLRDVPALVVADEAVAVPARRSGHMKRTDSLEEAARRREEAMNAEADRRTKTQSRDHIVPDELRTARLLLRRWRPSDAAALQPVLAANSAHLAPWIP